MSTFPVLTTKCTLTDIKKTTWASSWGRIVNTITSIHLTNCFLHKNCKHHFIFHGKTTWRSVRIVSIGTPRHRTCSWFLLTTQIMHFVHVLDQQPKQRQDSFQEPIDYDIKPQESITDCHSCGQWWAKAWLPNFIWWLQKAWASVARRQILGAADDRVSWQGRRFYYYISLGFKTVFLSFL